MKKIMNYLFIGLIAVVAIAFGAEVLGFELDVIGGTVAGIAGLGFMPIMFTADPDDGGGGDDDSKKLSPELKALVEKHNENFDGLKKEIKEMKEALPQEDEEGRKKLQTQIDGMEKKADDEFANIAKMQEQLNQIDVKLGKIAKGGEDEEVSLSKAFKEVFEANEENFNLLKEGKSEMARSFEIKAPVNIAGNFTGDVVPQDRIPGIWNDPFRVLR